jgi:galactokinase
MADLKRTIYELNNRINSVNLEHKYEIENIHRDWSEKYHMALQAHTENDQSHKQKLKTIVREKERVLSDLKTLQN